MRVSALHVWGALNLAVGALVITVALRWGLSAIPLALWVGIVVNAHLRHWVDNRDTPTP